MTKQTKDKPEENLEVRSENLAEPSQSEEKEIEEILKERSAELKEKEQREKEEEKKARAAAIEKRKEESLEHQAKVRKVQVRVRPRHGKKYIEKAKKIEKGTIYKLSEAIVLVKELSTTKFDASLDAHINVLDENARGIIHLPHGTGKKINVAIASEDLIEEITKGKINFDVLVTHPSFMPKLAKVAKILGPKGLMPSPKSGTISENPEEAKKELESGKLEYRADKDKVVHQSVGRISWEAKKLEENLQTLIRALVSAKIKSAYLAPTMGPSVKLEVE